MHRRWGHRLDWYRNVLAALFALELLSEASSALAKTWASIKGPRARNIRCPEISANGCPASIRTVSHQKGDIEAGRCYLRRAVPTAPSTAWNAFASKLASRSDLPAEWQQRINLCKLITAAQLADVQELERMSALRGIGHRGSSLTQGVSSNELRWTVQM
jgi:hypothetical protein